jgi:HEAT repeat protein
MSIPEPILQLAQVIAGAVIESLVDRGMVADSILAKLGRDPTKVAFAQALARAIDDFRQEYAEWYANLFDESFFRHEAAPLLAEFLLINGAPDSAELARRWAVSLAQTSPQRAQALTWQCEPAAAAFLENLGDELLAEEALRDVHNARNLQSMMETLRALAAQQGIARSTARSRRVYLQWLVDRNRYLDPRGTYQTQRQVQLKLDEVYITLRARPEEQLSHTDRRLLDEEMAHLDALTGLNPEAHEDRRDELFARRLLRDRPQPSSAPLDLDQVVNQQSRLVILGDPGSGKTTLLRHLALTHAQALLSGPPPATPPPATSPLATARFPIFLRIAAYAEWDEWRQGSLSDYLPQYFDGNECPAAGLADLFAKELAAGGCLLLLDGLDEIVDAADRRAIVDKIENFIQRHATGGPRGENRFVITSRIAGYRSAPVAGSGAPVAHYEVLEMDLPQIERFVTRWCHAVEEAQTPDLPLAARQTTARREITGILDAVKANEGVRRLAANPLLLRTLALIHRTGAQLPQRRIELYKLAADTLARTWRPAQQVRMGAEVSKLLDETYLTRLLGKLAYWLHLHKPTGLVTEAEVYARLGEEWAAILGRPWDADQPDPLVLDEVKKFLAAVREHTGLFVERAPKRYGFMHLTFEEYYAARHLVARSRTRAKLIRQHLHDPRWEEPILLALGFVGLDAPEDAAELVETAILAQGEEAADLGFRPSAYEELLGRDYFFALRCLGDRIPVRPQTLMQLVSRVRQEVINPTRVVTFERHQNVLTERVKGLADSIVAQTLFDLLLPALDDTNAAVRFRVAARLGQLGIGTPAVVDSLLAALGDDDDYARRQAVSTLVQLGINTPAVVDGLLVALHDDSDYMRLSAAASLVQLGSDTPTVVDGLLAALCDGNPAVRYNAATSLGQLGSDTLAVVTGLLVALSDNNDYVRNRAAESLIQLGISTSAVVDALLATLSNGNDYMRSRAAASLGQLGGSTPVVVDALLTALNDDDDYVHSRAAESLVQLGISTPVVVDALLTALGDENDFVRSHAAASLGQLGSGTPVVVDGLLTALCDSDAEVRRCAAESLVQLGNGTPAVVTGLFTALRDDNAEVRHRAAASLGQLGNTSSVLTSIWLEGLQRSESWSTRCDCVQLLGEYGIANIALIDVLLQGLLDQDYDICTACGTALACLGKRFPATKAIIEEKLVAAIGDPTFEKRNTLRDRTGQDYAHEALWQVVS